MLFLTKVQRLKKWKIQLHLVLDRENGSIWLKNLGKMLKMFSFSHFYLIQLWKNVCLHLNFPPGQECHGHLQSSWLTKWCLCSVEARGEPGKADKLGGARESQPGGYQGGRNPKIGSTQSDQPGDVDLGEAGRWVHGVDEGAGGLERPYSPIMWTIFLSQEDEYQNHKAHKVGNDCRKDIQTRMVYSEWGIGLLFYEWKLIKTEVSEMNIRITQHQKVRIVK